MNRTELYRLHSHLTGCAKSLMRLKNRDYGENDDPFRNFRAHGLLGILVRLHDKLARLQTFVETGTLTVKSEPVTDCVLDIINYSILFEGYRRDADRKGSTGRDTPEPKPAWSFEQGPVPLLTHTRAGDARSDSRGARRGEAAQAFYSAAKDAAEFAHGIGSSRRGKRPVGRKSRRGGKS